MPTFAPNARTARTTPVGQQPPANPAQPPKGKSPKAKDNQIQDNGNKGQATAQAMWTGSNGSQVSTTTVTPNDIRKLEGQLTHKWLAPFVAVLVASNSNLEKKHGRLTGKKVDEYRKDLSAKFTSEEKKALHVASQADNIMTATFTTCSLASSGMISPITAQVFFPNVDSEDIGLMQDIRKIVGLGRVDQAQLESEGARS